MTRSDADIAYKLLESKHPFPAAAIADSHPLSMKLSGALAKGLSLSGGCVYRGIVVLISSILSAVKVKYSGILGVYANVLSLQHGSRGTAKASWCGSCPRC